MFYTPGVHAPDSRWIFGYGSLIWRPGFQFEEKIFGSVTGWARKFWQGSTDHRGTPGAPGRVVTLIAEPSSSCFGACYRVRDSVWEAVMGRLDYREKNGYERAELDVASPNSGVRVSATTYIATPSNPHYLGEATHQVIAETIASAHGPSGSNLEYFMRLRAALEEEGIRETHLEQLYEALVISGACSGPSG